MKRSVNQTGKINKGAPSGFLISLLFHVGAFFIAGLFVVFVVVNKPEPEFEPPPAIERPRMKLKKPKVKIRKSSNPKPSSRIVAKVKTRDMPAIQLPDLEGVGDGLLGGIGDGDILGRPDIQGVSLFGETESLGGNELAGTYYDFLRDRNGNDSSMTPDEYAMIMDNFLSRDWSRNQFGKYFKAPRTLYTKSIAIPPLKSFHAPRAFGEEDGKGWFWAIHYTGKIAHHEDIRFRFWGLGDDILAVRLDGELVFLSCLPKWGTELKDVTIDLWDSSAPEDEVYPIGNFHAVVGDWVELKAYEYRDLEILIGESRGGIFTAMLMVEVEGVEYDRNPFYGGPTLPFFAMAPFSKDQVEEIYNRLQPGEATCERGPVFDDYSGISAEDAVPMEYEDAAAVPPPPLIAAHVPELRSWTTADERQFEAKYLTRVVDAVLLETREGRQQKMPIRSLSSEDRDYVMLLNPPEMKIDFIKRSDQKMPPDDSPWLRSPSRRIQIADYQFGVRLKTTSVNNDYDKPLTVEYFAVGDEVAGDNFVLLDRQSTTFIPTRDFEGEFVFEGARSVEVMKLALQRARGGMRGVEYGGYLITVSDELGRIVQYRTSNEFLFENSENLKKLPVGKHFNRNCNRVMPDRPREEDRFRDTLY
jgi:hypothetical protein